MSTRTSGKPVRVFISHATHDRDFVESEIVSLLESHGIETWFSIDSIRGSEDWQKRIRAGLEGCDWFLVALSAHAVQSAWVQTEVHWALENRSGRVIPVLIGDCKPADCHLMLHLLQFIDFRTELAAARRKLLQLWWSELKGPARGGDQSGGPAMERKGAAASDDPPLPCPFRGLFAFREQDASTFFGRTAFTDRLLDLVRKEPLAVVVGPSGSGKSSVLFAGLIPRLRKTGRWQVASFRPGQRPFHALAAGLVPLLVPGGSEIDRLVEARKLAAALEEGRISLQDVVEQAVEGGSGSRVLLVADQFEELYTLCREPEQRQQFLDRLLEVLKAQVRAAPPIVTVAISLRADFFGHALSYRPFADALQNSHVILGPMTRDELSEAIERPAEQAGVRVEEGLIDRILNTFNPESLPLVEFALTLLWAKRTGGRLTHAAYDAIGGVEQALARYAEEQFKELGATERQRAETIFVQLIRPGEGTEDTRRLAVRADVGGVNWDLVTRLATARLVVTGRDHTSGEETAEIVHEALIRNWGRLREWMHAHRAFRTWQDRLRATVRQWEASNRNDGVLLRGAPLAEAEEWLERRADGVGPREQEFILASRAQQDQEQKRWQQLYEEVKALNDKLEQRVEDRTREFSLLNEQLERRVLERTRQLQGANEELAIARDQALVANRAKSTFLESMSHELRTPLNAIIGYTELLQEEAEDKGNRDYLPDLGKIHGAGKHLLGLINDLLDISKIEGSKINLYPEMVDVLALLDNVAAAMRPLMEKNNNAFVILCSPDTGSLHVDLTRLRQCLFNLLSNAAKFTSNGEVHLQVARASRQGRDWMVFRVRDTGIGMTPEQLARIFQPFVQAHTSMTRKYGGTGLGLAITSKLCAMMGGTVQAESEAGRGSVFTISLPAQGLDMEEFSVSSTPRLGESGTSVSKGSRVLVIDDDPNVLDLVERILTLEGVKVITASNGEEGLRFAKELKPSLITLDALMPGMDGLAVLAALKADLVTAEIPVVMISTSDDRKLGDALGAADWLVKPVEPATWKTLLARFSGA